MKGLSSESLSLPCSKGRMWCNCLTALPIIVINSNNDKASMLLLLYFAFRKGFPPTDERKERVLPAGPSVFYPDSTFQCNSAKEQKTYLNRLGIWFLLQMTLQTFSARKLVNIHLLSTIPPNRGKIAHFLCVWGMRIYFKDDYNLMFTVIINYSRPSGMQGAKLQRNWSVRSPANRTWGYCDSFGHLMF